MAALTSVELSSQLSRRTRAETLATQAKGTLAGVSALYGVGDFTIDFIVIGKTLEEIKTAFDKNRSSTVHLPLP